VLESEKSEPTTAWLAARSPESGALEVGRPLLYEPEDPATASLFKRIVASED